MKTFLTAHISCTAPLVLLAWATAGSAPALAAPPPPAAPSPAASVQGGASDTPRVGRNLIAAAEKNLDNRFTRLWDDNPFVVLGPTRGVYLDGFGGVFTAEVNLVAGPVVGIMTPPRTLAEIARHKKKKSERIPELKKALQLALAELAASPEMAAVPPDEQIVLVAFLSHYPWEDLTGLPAQITMQGSKQKLVEALRAGGGPNIEAAIRAAQL
jgi:hypothetical protein